MYKFQIGYAKTGGGTHTPKTDEIDGKIISSLKAQFEPDRNPFDSSAALYECEEPVSPPTFNSEYVTLPHVEDTIRPATSSAAAVSDSVHNSVPGDVIFLDLDVSDDKSTKSKRGEKRKKDDVLEELRDTIISRKKSKTITEGMLAEKRMAILDEELQIKKEERMMKAKQNEKKIELLEIEKKIKEYDLKIKELEYKSRLKQLEFIQL